MTTPVVPPAGMNVVRVTIDLNTVSGELNSFIPQGTHPALIIGMLQLTAIGLATQVPKKSPLAI